MRTKKALLGQYILKGGWRSIRNRIVHGSYIMLLFGILPSGLLTLFPISISVAGMITILTTSSLSMKDSTPDAP